MKVMDSSLSIVRCQQVKQKLNLPMVAPIDVEFRYDEKVRNSKICISCTSKPVTASWTRCDPDVAHRGHPGRCTGCCSAYAMRGVFATMQDACIEGFSVRKGRAC